MRLSRRRRRLLTTLAIGLLALAVREFSPRSPTGGDDAARSIEELYAERARGESVHVEGRVERLLPDDEEGSRHQRFVLTLVSGHTLLVAHNIDLAPRVPLEIGDLVEVRGDYEWNERGGVVHWTHHDPQARREGGFVRHDGIEYR